MAVKPKRSKIPLTEEQKREAANYYDFAMRCGRRYSRTFHLSDDQTSVVHFALIEAVKSPRTAEQSLATRIICVIRRRLHTLYRKGKKHRSLNFCEKIPMKMVDSSLRFDQIGHNIKTKETKEFATQDSCGWYYPVSRNDPTSQYEQLDEFENLIRPCQSRQKTLLRTIYRDGGTQGDLVEDLGVTKSRISSLHSEALDCIRNQRIASS